MKQLDDIISGVAEQEYELEETPFTEPFLVVLRMHPSYIRRQTELMLQWAAAQSEIRQRQEKNASFCAIIGRRYLDWEPAVIDSWLSAYNQQDARGKDIMKAMISPDGYGP